MAYFFGTVLAISNAAQHLNSWLVYVMQLIVISVRVPRDRLTWKRNVLLVEIPCAFLLGNKESSINPIIGVDIVIDD